MSDLKKALAANSQKKRLEKFNTDFLSVLSKISDTGGTFVYFVKDATSGKWVYCSNEYTHNSTAIENAEYISIEQIRGLFDPSLVRKVNKKYLLVSWEENFNDDDGKDLPVASSSDSFRSDVACSSSFVNDDTW